MVNTVSVHALASDMCEIQHHPWSRLSAPLTLDKVVTHLVIPLTHLPHFDTVTGTLPDRDVCDREVGVCDSALDAGLKRRNPKLDVGRK